LYGWGSIWKISQTVFQAGKDIIRKLKGINMKVFVFNKGFLTDWNDGLGVIFANSRRDAIVKMAKLIYSDFDYDQALFDFNIREFVEFNKGLDIAEYEMNEFPGVYIHGGS
jgi:hypothetical protein